MITGAGFLELLLKHCIRSDLTSPRPVSPLTQVEHERGVGDLLQCVLLAVG